MLFFSKKILDPLLTTDDFYFIIWSYTCKRRFIMEFKGSKTEKNLWEAFAGESQARNKYTYFASKAKKEGYEQIAA